MIQSNKGRNFHELMNQGKDSQGEGSQKFISHCGANSFTLGTVTAAILHISGIACLCFLFYLFRRIRPLSVFRQPHTVTK